MSATPTPAQVARLPRWAQDHLARLERQVQELLAEREPQKPTAVAHNPYARHLRSTERPTYLDPTDPVRFALDHTEATQSRDYVDVQLLRDGTLDITCDGALLVLPRASNRALVQVADRGAVVRR